MTVAESDERWAGLGRQACVTLAPLFTTIEHLDENLTPGLIELRARVENLHEVDERALETLGYRRAPGDGPGRRYRREDYDSTAYCLHVVTVGN